MFPPFSLLQAARIPCDADSISEMIKLMDANCDGCISWDEFEKFMMSGFAAGQRLLSGEFMLPSGERGGKGFAGMAQHRCAHCAMARSRQHLHEMAVAAVCARPAR